MITTDQSKHGRLSDIDLKDSKGWSRSTSENGRSRCSIEFVTRAHLFLHLSLRTDLVDASFWGFSQEQTIGWLRQSEVKHGRVAMAGT